jgi:hypothetical protein
VFIQMQSSLWPLGYYLTRNGEISLTDGEAETGMTACHCSNGFKTLWKPLDFQTILMRFFMVLHGLSALFKKVEDSIPVFAVSP